MDEKERIPTWYSLPFLYRDVQGKKSLKVPTGAFLARI
jgi:hypothetical protein